MALPCEMIDEVLCRVPVKYVLRCRSVCKDWCSLIDSTAFVKKHLKTSRDRNAGAGLMIIKVCADQMFYLASLDSLYEDSASVVKICDPLKTLLRGAEYVCACNGLMCVLKNLRDVYLLNPVLRKFKKVASAPPEFPSSFKWDERFSFGFGYDVVNDDYKSLFTASKPMFGHGFKTFQITLVLLEFGAYLQVDLSIGLQLRMKSIPRI
ncbi:F-box/kelch-repeat protein At3g23880-like [Apium graveolens]|uniref:F-box/kelch-repeat protein At3g23880-like n=1 Tax=Apium graveolens TaxID=4045 RepID=UPI003D7AA2C1